MVGGVSRIIEWKEWQANPRREFGQEGKDAPYQNLINHFQGVAGSGTMSSEESARIVRLARRTFKVVFVQTSAWVALQHMRT